MQYLPGRCDACGFVVLVAHVVPAARPRPCPKCCAEVTIFPGAKHPEDERPAFEVLSWLVHEGATAGRAALVLDELEDLIEDAPTTLLHAIELRIPSISATLLAAKSTMAAPKLLAILLTLLRARSSVRMYSDLETMTANSTGELTQPRRSRPLRIIR